MRDVLHLDNTQVGFLNSMFGLLALICYFPGGWLADRFSARKLLVVSLLATGLGGLYLATVPSYAELLALHAFWGVASILTFWAALIKATRELQCVNSVELGHHQGVSMYSNLHRGLFRFYIPLHSIMAQVSV